MPLNGSTQPSSSAEVAQHSPPDASEVLDGLENNAVQAREDALRAEIVELRAVASAREAALLAEVAEARSALATIIADAKKQGVALRGVPKWRGEKGTPSEAHASAAKKAAETIQRFSDSTIVAAAAAESSRIAGLRAAAAERVAAVEKVRREGAAALAAVQAAHAAELQNALRKAQKEAEAARISAVQSARDEAANELKRAVDAARREALASQAAAVRKARVDGVAELVAELEAVTRAETPGSQSAGLGADQVAASSFLSPTTRCNESTLPEAPSKSPWQAPLIESDIVWKSCFFNAKPAAPRVPQAGHDRSLIE